MSITSDLQHFPQILVVCTGNICRSPMGEVVLSHMIHKTGLKIKVISAGISNEEKGKGIYPPAQKVLTEAGYEIPVRSAHRVTDEELRTSGLIIAMTAGHAKVLRRRCEIAHVPVERIHLWREFDDSGVCYASRGCFGPGGFLEELRAPQTTNDSYRDYEYSHGECDVPDPWYGDHQDFVNTLATVEKGAQGLLDLLTRK